MRISIVAVGKMKSGPERELAERYLTRTRNNARALGITEVRLTELTESRASSAPARKRQEAQYIRATLPEGVRLIALDEHGDNTSSQKFAKRLSQWRDDGVKSTCFIIGGPDGLDPELVKSCQQVLSFSALTWPHQIVRIMLAEQLYRATTILSGHPYHRA